MNVIKIAVAAACIHCGLAPAFAQTFHGVTCDDVRQLSQAEQNYWSAELRLTAAQRHRIYVACYVRYNDHRGRDRRSADNTLR